MRRRSTRAWAWSAGLTVAVASLGAYASGTAHASPPPDQLAPAGSAPNYYYPSDLANSASVAAFADPANGLLFEYEQIPPQGSCVNLVSFDIDTYSLRSTDAASCSQITPANPGHTKAAPLAVDPIDRVLFVADANGSIVAVSEDSLRVIATITPPASANASATLDGLSWDPGSDGLLVLFSGVSGVNIGPTFELAFYAAKAVLHGASASPVWTASVPDCVEALTPTFATADAYLTADRSAALVACILVPSPGLGTARNGERDGVVRVPLSASGPTSAPSTVAAAPGLLSDVYFDPTSSRMFLPVTASSSVDLLVYDGTQGGFAGKATVGGVNDEDQVAVGLETTTGRLYAVAPETGITIVDGRLTPVSPGGLFAADRAKVSNTLIATLPPDRVYSYERILVPVELTDPKSNLEFTPALTVYADTVPTPNAPAPNSVDSNTFNGAVPPGTSLSTVYAASAAAYGYHDDTVGGVNAVVSNVSGGGAGAAGPFSGSSDLLGADVSKLTVDSSNGAEARASALGDGSGATSGSVQQCTGTTAASCLPPPPCPAGLGTCLMPPSVPAPPGASYSQTWPYPDAVCFAPGPPQSESGATNGFYVITPSAANAAPAPGSDSAGTAAAQANCAGAGGAATAAAQLGQSQTNASGLPQVVMGYATSASSITLSPGNAGVVTTSQASTNGVSIDLGNGSTITIGFVSQSATARAAGTAGSAMTTDSVTVRDITVNGGELCGTANCAAAIDKINAEFPSFIHITLSPAADDRYSTNCTTDPSNAAQRDCHGSPGGYLASVQASLDEQYGDQQFNGMSEEESTLLPAMRIILYGYQDGSPSISRMVLDLAGVEDSASQGLQPVLSGGGGSSSATSSYTPLGCVSCAAGVPSTPIAVRSGAPTYAPGLLGVVERLFNGFLWLLRSPLGVLQMAGFLTLLALPLLMMRRRWRLGMSDGKRAA